MPLASRQIPRRQLCRRNWHTGVEGSINDPWMVLRERRIATGAAPLEPPVHAQNDDQGPREQPEASIVVELRGLEPLTLCMPCRCATNCATAPSARQS